MSINKRGIKITNASGETVIEADNKIGIVDRKPQKGETIRIGEKVAIQNNGDVGSQTIVNLDTVNGDLYL